jgi:hypothetical protein
MVREMNFEPLMDAVTEMLLLLEFNDDVLLDDDAAVETMEQIARTIQGLGKAERTAYIGYLERRAAQPGEEKQFLLTLPEVLGIANP